MTIRNLSRIGLFLGLLLTAVAPHTDAAAIYPVQATPYRFTTGSTQSSVDVMLSNPNPFDVYVKFSVQAELPNGVTRTWPAAPQTIGRGNSSVRAVLPFEIAGVRWARVTSIQL